MKKISTLVLRNFLLLLATLFTISTLAQAQTKLAAPRLTQAIDDTRLVTIHRSVHPMARTGFDQGVVADSFVVNRMLLVLQRSQDQETALRTLMDSQQTKNSPNYHAWLTPAQFGQQFGVADTDIQKVSDWLAQKGFTGIKATGPGKMFIEFNGTAGTVRTAFHTELHSFLINGEKHVANVSDPQIPAALAPVVARIHALHDFQQKAFLHKSKALDRALVDGKLKPSFGTGTGLFGVGPGDLAKIYNIPATVGGSPAGQGQTIAIVARSNINIQDINDFGNGFNIPALIAFSAANNVIVNGPDPGIVAGDADEATVDVEMAGSAAPNANILLVVNGGVLTGNLAGLGFPNGTDGVDQSALYIVENNLAPVMSQSFGACEADSDTLFSSTLWEQAAAQGITVAVSTGDSGSDVCDADQGNIEATTGLSVSGSASTPFNVAVGGTDFDDATNPTTFWNDTAALETAKGYIPEITWNNGCAAAGSLTGCTSVDSGGLDLSGGSGGQSNCGVQNFVPNPPTCTGYPKPAWQSAPGVPADGVRDIPDVSLFAAVNSASNNFYVICDSATNFVPGQPCNLTGTGAGFNFSGFGGTSLSTPAFAGIMALVNQSELAAGRGGRQGNANYVLYKLATAQGTTPGNAACNSSTGPGASCTFNDVTKGNNSVVCTAGTPNCSNQTATGFGILVEPATPNPPFSATTPGFTTTAGYDLATGLGSLNVTNLITNWGAVVTNFKTATPAITSPATNTVNITHGANQTFTVTVTGSGGTPTGDVSLIAEPPGFGQVGAGFGTLTNGTATITTNTLPGDVTSGTAGTPYPLIVHYAGDGTFGPADSQPINVTVNREATTVTETLFNEDIVTGALTPTTSVQYGTNYIMVVNVVGNTAGAICNNSSNFNPNVPSTITQIPTVPCPTGTVTLKDNGNPLNDFVQTGGPNTNSSSVSNLGFVEDLLIQLLGGANSIVATYSGDNSYASGTSPTGTFTVTPGPTATNVTLNGGNTATVASGQTVTLVATVTTGYTQTCSAGTCSGRSNGAGPTGTVTFSSCGSAGSCTVPVVPTAFNATNGGAFSTATLNTSFTTTPTQPITAVFTTADANYISCATSGTPANCSLTGLTVTVTTSATITVSSTALTLNSATGASGTSTITVTSQNGFNSAVTVSLPSSLPPGVSCTAPASITPPANGTATGTLSCQVTATSATLTASNIREDRVLDAKVIAPKVAVPPATGGKGWWALSAGTGFAAMFLFFLPGGRKKYRAALGLSLACILAFTLGCGGGSSGGGGLPATVTKLTVTSGKVASGTAFSFSVAVTGGTPGGSVQLFDNGVMIGTAATVASGTAAPTAPALSVGTHSISAHYLGDSKTMASQSGSLNLTVTGPTTIAITTTPAATPAAPAVSVTIN